MNDRKLYARSTTGMVVRPHVWFVFTFLPAHMGPKRGALPFNEIVDEIYAVVLFFVLW